MRRRLVLSFDGTWEQPSTAPGPAAGVESNVCRFHASVIDGLSDDGAVQVRFYDSGVGVTGSWVDHILGGALGVGLDQKIRDGYAWLVENWPADGADDTSAYIVGFSRGAYTARSLAGMISLVGLLRTPNPAMVRVAYTLYRDRTARPADVQQFRQAFARAPTPTIQFLGVWDTVGALGIPLPALARLNNVEYAFHDTALGANVSTAVHAVAVDEHCADFTPTLWTSVPDPARQTVVQRWFAGAHGDVGGGYADRRLSDVTLRWMQEQAIAAGLVLDPGRIPAPDSTSSAAPIHDSYGQFLGGLYAATHPPFYRPMRIGPDLLQTVDGSVHDRCRADPTYRPRNAVFPLPEIPPP
jgi:uncharacterized protein (DUF2235 family)